MDDQSIAGRIGRSLRDGGLPCPRALRIAAGLGIDPARVRQVADQLDIKIIQCQLGLFGYSSKQHGVSKIVKPAKAVPARLERGIRSHASGDRLGCAQAFDIADGLHLKRLAISNAAEGLGIKIASCQLGCFG